MSDLSYADALALAQNMRNHYQAFAGLAEVLDLAATALSDVETNKRKLDELNQAIADAESQKFQAVQAATQAQAAHAQMLVDLEAAATAKKQDLDQQYLQASDTAEAEFAAHKKSLTNEIDGLTADRNSLRDQVEQSRKELEGLQGAVAETRAFLQNLRVTAGA